MNDLIYLLTYHKHVVSFVWRDCLERSPCMLKIGCLNPGCDAPNSLKQKWLFHCQTLRNKCECHGSSEMTLKRCGKLKFTAQLPRASDICVNLQSFRGMMISVYDWKIIKRIDTKHKKTPYQNLYKIQFNNIKRYIIYG